MLNLLVEGQFLRARLSHDVLSGGIIISPEGTFMGIAVAGGVEAEIITYSRASVVYLPTEDSFNTEYQKVYLRTADLKIVSSPLPVLIPPDPSLTVLAGGTLTDGTYYYVVTVEDTNGESMVGTVANETVSAPNNTIEVDFPLVTGGVSYNIYRGVAPDSLYWISSAAGAPFVDDGSYSTTTVEPPSYNKTGTQEIGRYLSGYTGAINTVSSIKTDPDGTITRVEFYDVQKWVPSGNISILLIS